MQHISILSIEVTPVGSSTFNYAFRIVDLCLGFHNEVGCVVLSPGWYMPRLVVLDFEANYGSCKVYHDGNGNCCTLLIPGNYTAPNATGPCYLKEVFFFLDVFFIFSHF